MTHPRDGMLDMIGDLRNTLHPCAIGYGEAYPWMGAHDAAKRLYRMGWRRVAEPETGTCRHCLAEGVVLAQAICIDCVGKPARPARDAQPARMQGGAT